MSAIINEDAPPAPTAGALGPVIAALLRREPADRPDASAATRMITDVLPLLPATSGPEPAGYEATALSASSRPKAPAPGETSLDFGSSEHTDRRRIRSARWRPPTRSGGEPASAGTAPTTPQPVLGDAARYDQAAYERPTEYGEPAYRSRPGTTSRRRSSTRRGAGPPAEPVRGPRLRRRRTFRPGTTRRPGQARRLRPSPGRARRLRPSPGRARRQRWVRGQGGNRAGPGARVGLRARPGPGAAAGARPDYRPAPPRPRRRRGGLWLALALLALLGAGAGAAAIVLLRHSTAGTPIGQGSSPPVSSSGSAGTLPPATLQIVDAVNTSPGALPAGWATVRQQATGTARPPASAIAAPSNWTQSTSGYQTYLRDPAANANILIDLTPHTYPNDMVAEAQFIKNQSLAQNRFPGYSQAIGGLAATPIRGTRGAWWKFTWDDNGVTQEAIDLLFVLHTRAGAQSYALYMTAPASMWSQMRPIFDEEVETFAPLT